MPHASVWGTSSPTARRPDGGLSYAVLLLSGLSGRFGAVHLACASDGDAGASPRLDLACALD
jgi:hypothetical protein